jgi:aspartate/methionine/tyrosine aminotransferase
MTRISIAPSPAFVPFLQEMWQSLHETEVSFNVADSAVRCVPLGELLRPGHEQELSALELYYPQVNGTTLLREQIAAAYSSAVEESQVLVTVGAAEANQIVCQTLLVPGDRVVVIEPGYRQVRGLALNLGCQVEPVQLCFDDAWHLDLDQLAAAITPRTKLLYVVNPNNPTGTVLAEEQMDAIIDLVERTGCFLLADEVYRGSELDGDRETPSFVGRHPRVIATNSLSKAYGLCGLRIGWVVADAELIEACWRRHEYAVISAAAPSVLLAEYALEPQMRQRLLQRQRAFLREGARRVEEWVVEHDDLLEVVPPVATALSFPRYRLTLDSVAVADALRRDASVLVIPGSTMGAEHHLRITHGFEPRYLDEALHRIAVVLRTLAQ